MAGLLIPIIFTTFFLLLGFLFLFSFVMPIAGSITRLRANYVPKGVRLDEEAGKGRMRVFKDGGLMAVVQGIVSGYKHLEGLDLR